MEPESSLPHSQEPATCPYPEPCVLTRYEIYIADPSGRAV
jgi:hypothetical protein